MEIVGEFLAVHATAHKALAVEEALHKKKLVILAQGHPLARVVESVRGLDYPGLGLLLGATGSLDRFEMVANLWSYCGMAVVNGAAPKRTPGVQSRWSERARVVCHQVGGPLLKYNDGRYREAYDRKRAEYLARPRLGPSACPCIW